jgi:hypothetical protein
MLLSVPPKYSITMTIEHLKPKSAIQIHGQLLKKKEMLFYFLWPLEALYFDTFPTLDFLIIVVLLQSEIRITFWVLHFPEPTLRPLQ